MSVDHYVRLRCDVQLADLCANRTYNLPASTSADELWLGAERLGWMKSGVLDVCPDCVQITGLRRKRPQPQ